MLRITESTVHAFCRKGKQRRNRSGVYFCIPSTFTNGWDWSVAWRRAFEALPPARQGNAAFALIQKGTLGLCESPP